MKLIFMYHPVKNVRESLEFYQEKLGFEEAWREGEGTIALRIPESEVQLLIEEEERDLSPGGVYLVDSVDGFFNDKRDTFTFIKEPVDIPPGRYAIYEDNSGNPLRIIDFSKK
ncbi:VOC family protein [Alteribacter keqinensis]|uniref:Glyoxalase/fosfomycin resistance/dioxygenase domain-containing protein n=1 Tax=Alteribacter keqinensis TaxID=2483800 RepID=A0A3M7TN48_9BACI|nr:VOC family protein [Alteribacter keqinensis]RNA66882.1 hypothetical protein EBO34_16905 [Alteribacter keqinensis]